MTDDQLIFSLQKLGLNLYASRAYVALLLRKQLTAKDLGQMTTIPQSRTYDVLESLKDKGFALTTPSSPKLYTPVDPQRILPSYYAITKKQVQAQVMKIQEEAEAKLTVLHDAFSNLMKELPDMRTEGLKVPEPVWVVEGRENIESEMVSLIQKAQSEFLRITRPPDLRNKFLFDPFYFVGIERRKFIYDALERDVKMRWLSLSREIPSFLGMEIEDEPERRCLERDEEIPEKFVLVDNKTVLLNLRDPVSQTFGSVALMMESERTSAIFKEHFEAMWRRAMPVNEVLRKTQKLVEEVCSKMNETGFNKTAVTLFKNLARIGATRAETLFEEMRKRRAVTSEVSAALDRLLRTGLVHRNDSLKLLMVEDPRKVMASIKEGSLLPSKR